MRLQPLHRRCVERVAALLFGALYVGLPAYASTNGGYVGHQVIVGDFNGDGWMDLLLQPMAGYHNTAELIAYPDGNFGPPTATWNDQSGGTDWNADAHRLVVGDFNGDGRDDVLLQGAAGLPSQIAFARSDGTLPQADVTLPATLGGLDLSQATHQLVVGDFNGDGQADILLQANTFTGTDGIALSNGQGTFHALASHWQDGYQGLSWSADRAAIAAGDFDESGQDELLVRSAAATGSTTCCELMGFDKKHMPDVVAQSWPTNYLGLDWEPAAERVIVGDFNGDGRDDVLLQPTAAGGELAIVLSDAKGQLATLADHWTGNNKGFDWSAQSYELVPEAGPPGEGEMLLMVPKMAGLPYRRASFSSSGMLLSVTTISPPAANALSDPTASGSGGGALMTANTATTTSTTAPATPAGDTPGTMAGSANVTNGAAGYSIKIAVPPGRMGMQPALSLGYSSNGGDGQEGAGWSLGGLSSIYRCPGTWASDGATAGVTFSMSDHFCLDGAKLMLTSGSLGVGGSIYHAEVNGYAKVAAVGSLGKGPSSFTVTTTDGRTLTYSAELTSANGSAFTWALTKSVDLDGNQINYTYGSSASEYWPTEIDYTLGNGSPGTTRKVKFVWGSRSDVGAANIVHYVAGMQLSTSKLLTHIQTWVGSTEVRDYQLSYSQSPATNRPLLNWVQECAWNASGVEHCLNPTTFNYQGQQAPTFAPATGTSLGLVDPGSYATGCRLSNYGQWSAVADVNGDGRVDLVQPNGDNTTSTSGFSYQEGNWGGFDSTFSALNISPPAGAGGWTMDALRNAIDFNLDGRTDLMMTVSPGEDAYIGYMDAPSASTVLDTGAKIPTEPSGQTWPAPYFYDPLVGDVNGDGLSDLILATHPSSSAYDIEVYTASRTNNNTTYSLKWTFPLAGEITSAQVIDYNADGRSDLLVGYYNASYYTLLISNGGSSNSGFDAYTTNIPVVANPNLNAGGNLPITVADVNGDSLPDIVEPKSVNGTWQWVVYPNEGDANGQFGAAVTTGIPVGTTTTNSVTYLLNEFVKVFRDPDGHTDLLIPTARTFLYPKLTKPCTTDGCYQGTPWPDASSICNNIRTNYNPESHDGYDWELYRADGSHSGFGFSDFGQVAHNVEAGTRVIFDANGNGLPDVVGIDARTPEDYVSDSFKHKNRIVGFELSYNGGTSPGPVPDLLTVASNGFGVTDTFSYQPTTNSAVYTRDTEWGGAYPNMLFQSTMQVVASLKETNPAGGTNTTSYAYHNARYNVAGRGFMGFATVTADLSADTASNTKTVTTYDQSHPFPRYGRETGQITTSDQNPQKPFQTTAITWTPTSYTPDGVTRYQVYASDRSEETTDPTNGFASISQSDTTQFNVDDCGNPKNTHQMTTTYGANSQEEASKTVDTTNTYNGGSIDDCDQDTIASQVAAATVSYPQTPATSDTLTLTTVYGYGASNWWQLTSKDISAARGGTAEGARHFTYSYDGFGNRKTVTATDESTNRTATSNFGTDGYFPVWVKNPMSQQSTFTYDPATGHKLTATDPNGCVTTYAWDAFGRPAGGQPCGKSAVSISYVDPGSAGIWTPPTAVYVKNVLQPGYPTQKFVYDAFGNKLRTTVTGFDNSWIVTDARYDDLGRVTWTSRPHYSGATAYVTHYNSYDVLDRPASKQEPASGGNTRTIAMAYAGLTTTFTDTDAASGVTHTYSRTYDGLGKGNGHLIEVDDPGGTATYRYDAGGNLIQAKDPAGNTISATYDGFGDKLTLSDPDKGNWTYGYDGYGELTSVKNDARGDTITTFYDELGRKTETDDPADNNRVVNWTYDTQPYGIGKPATETVTVGGTATYERTYGYDTAGRPRASEVTTGGLTYLSGTSYDDDGRVNARAFPAAGGNSAQPPSVSAAANPAGPVAPGSAVSLVATGSDPNGTWGLSYHWVQDSGDAIQVPIDGADQAQASVTVEAVGSYHFTVTVTDGFSQASATVTIVTETAPTGTVTPTVSPTTSYDGTYTVTWTSVSTATSYEVKETTDGGTSWTQVATTGGTSWAASGKSAGTYAYEIIPCNPVGCGSAGGTASVAVSVPAKGSTPTVSPSPSYDGSYTVTWGSVTGASSYRLQESTDGGSTWTQVYSGSGQSWSASGKALGTYEYRTRGCDAVGCGAWGATATEQVTPPAGGSTPQLSPNPSHTGSFTVSWSAVTGATSYTLKQSVNGGAWTTVVSGNTSRTWSTSGNSAGTYKYQVFGCDALGCGSGGPIATETVSPPVAPGTPTLSPNPSADGSYTVSWSAPTGATSYVLQESVSGGSWSQVYSGSATSWSASGKAEAGYAYRVHACNTYTGCGSWSGSASETVAYIPATPTNLHHTPLTVAAGANYTLAWDATADTDTYELALDGTTPTQTGITTTSVTKTAPTTGDVDLYWAVRACGNGGCSPWSAQTDVYVQPSGGGGGGCRLCSPTLGAPTSGSGSASPSGGDGGTGALVVDYAYTSTGYVLSATRDSDGQVYATVTAMDAWGHVTTLTQGNGITVTRSYDQASGLTLSINASNGTATVADWTYDAWDAFGNLDQRTDHMNGVTETDSYDDLNRLQQTTVADSIGSVTTAFTYDATGNLTSRSDLGSLGYGPADGCGPHAVVSVNGGGSFACNSDGDYTADNGRTLTWTAFDKPTTITDGGTTVTTVTLSYDAERTRYQKQVSGATTETVTYLGGAERLDISGSVSIRRTITLAGEMVAVDTGGANDKLSYVVTEHLGSPIALSDTSGALEVGLAYGPFGRRMTTDRSAYLTISEALAINENYTDKSFTGQEGLDSVALDDYNARLYDPSLGRFLSVDPLIGHPESTQGINPYSYVENNPLNKTDPTGEADTSSCTGGGDDQTCTLGQISTKNVQSMSVNSDGSVTVHLTNGATMSSSAGALGADQVAEAALGAVRAFGTSSANFGNLSKMITGLDSNMANDHTQISPSRAKVANMAALSACSYDTTCDTMGHWNRTRDGIGASEFNDPSSGFKAALFNNGNQYALAFAGTDSLLGPDGEASAEQIAGLRSKQFSEAANLTGDVLNAPGVLNHLTLTGHSLGGALASFSALTYDNYRIPTLTFNAEGLSLVTLTRNHLWGAYFRAGSYITAYHTALDPVTLGVNPASGLLVPGRSVTLWNGLFHSGHGIHDVCGAVDVTSYGMDC